MLGYVYIMSNEAMPRLYKIGCTPRHPLERASISFAKFLSYLSCPVLRMSINSY